MPGKKPAKPVQLFAVAWLPGEHPDLMPGAPEQKSPITKFEAIHAGGRIVDSELPESYAKEVANCLNVGAPPGGVYLVAL